MTGFNKGSSQQLFQFRLSDFIISNNGITYIYKFHLLIDKQISI